MKKRPERFCVAVAKSGEVQEVQPSQVKTEEQAGLNDQVIRPRYSPEVLALLLDENTEHFRCCALKASVIAGLGFSIAPRDQVESPSEEERARLDDFLDENDLTAVLEPSWLDREAIGFGLFEARRNLLGEVALIGHAPGKDFRLTKTGTWLQTVNQGGVPKKTWFKAFGDERIIRADDGREDPDCAWEKRATELVILQAYHPNSPIYGQPDIVPAIGAIQLSRHIRDWNLRTFDSDFIPEYIAVFEKVKRPDVGGDYWANPFSAAVQPIDAQEVGIEETESPETWMDEDLRGAVEKTRKFLEDRIKSKNGPRPREILVVGLPDGYTLRLQRLSSEVKDGSFLDLRTLNRDETVRAHGVPPRLVGIISSGQLGGQGDAEGQMDVFLTTIVRPRQVALEALINNTLVKAGLGVNDWVIRITDWDVEDKGAALDVIRKRSELGLLTVNEMLQGAGLAPLDEDWADRKVILSGGRLIDLEDSLTAPAVPLQTAALEKIEWESDLENMITGACAADFDEAKRDILAYMKSVLGRGDPLTEADIDLLANYFASALGEVGVTSSRTIKSAIHQMYDRAKAKTARDLGVGDLAWNLVDDQTRAVLGEHTVYWIKTHGREVLAKNLAATAQEALENGLGRTELGQILESQFGHLADKSAAYWKMNAASMLSRSRAFGTVEAMSQAGVKKYRRYTMGDQRVCQRCRDLEGKVYTVAAAVKVRDAVLAAGDDPEAVKALMPWPTGDDPNPTPILGAIHGNCRCGEEPVI